MVENDVTSEELDDLFAVIAVRQRTSGISWFGRQRTMLASILKVIRVITREAFRGVVDLRDVRYSLASRCDLLTMLAARVVYNPRMVSSHASRAE